MYEKRFRRKPFCATPSLQKPRLWSSFFFFMSQRVARGKFSSHPQQLKQQAAPSKGCVYTTSIASILQHSLVTGCDGVCVQSETKRQLKDNSSGFTHKPGNKRPNPPTATPEAPNAPKSKTTRTPQQLPQKHPTPPKAKPPEKPEYVRT